MRFHSQMLTIPHCKESLSRAYITAVVARSLNNLSSVREHDYGVDGSIVSVKKLGERRVEAGFSFDFQAKASVNWCLENDSIIYDMEAQAFNDLAERTSVPRATPLILILLCLDTDESNWMTTSQESLKISRCAYWFKINSDLTGNSSSKRIRIPVGNQFDCDAVNNILEQIERGTFLP